MERRREFAAANLQAESYLEREHNARWAALSARHKRHYGQPKVGQKRRSRKYRFDTEMARSVVTRAAEKEKRNQIIGLICPFLRPRIFVKCPSIRKMDGRGGGDRKQYRLEFQGLRGNVEER